tara:strand:- start:1787 stop:2071 length:285 start_codon:yes stop_codon:yes gene_type:complete
MLSRLFGSGSFSKDDQLQVMETEIEALKEEIENLKSGNKEAHIMLNILVTANQTMAADLSMVYESLQKIVGASATSSSHGFRFTFRDEDDDLPN